MSFASLLNKIPVSTPGKTTDRLVAVACAMRLTRGSVVASGASSASDVTTPAQKFEAWLGDADTEEDALVRRMLLLMVCDKADEATPPDRIRALVKELHRHVTRR